MVSVKNDERCFTVENPSYENYYNAHILGEDGKNETIEVITAHLEVIVNNLYLFIVNIYSTFVWRR